MTLCFLFETPREEGRPNDEKLLVVVGCHHEVARLLIPISSATHTRYHTPSKPLYLPPTHVSNSGAKEQKWKRETLSLLLLPRRWWWRCTTTHTTLSLSLVPSAAAPPSPPLLPRIHHHVTPPDWQPRCSAKQPKGWWLTALRGTTRVAPPPLARGAAHRLAPLCSPARGRGSRHPSSLCLPATSSLEAGCPLPATVTRGARKRPACATAAARGAAAPAPHRAARLALLQSVPTVSTAGNPLLASCVSGKPLKSSHHHHHHRRVDCHSPLSPLPPRTEAARDSLC